MKTKARVALAAVAAALAAGCAAPNTAGTTVGLASEGEGGLQQILQTDNARLAKQLLHETRMPMAPILSLPTQTPRLRGSRPAPGSPHAASARMSVSSTAVM